MSQLNAVSQSNSNSYKRIPVEPDFWLLIFGDLLVFAAMFIAFMVRRFESEETYLVFSQGAESLSQTFGLFNTLLLLTSSYFVVKGLTSLRFGYLAQANRYIVFAIGCGSGFVIVKFYEYWEKLSDGVSVTSDRFFEFYFTFTGVHLLHVVVGIGLLSFSAWKHKAGNHQAAPSEAFMEGVGCYWHMVDLLWLMLFSLFYLLG